MSLNISTRIDDRKVKEAFRKAPRIMERRLGGAVQRVAQEIADDAREEAPKAFTTLTNSIRADRQDVFEYIAGPNVDYADAVEEGTDGGGWPSQQSLADWIAVKDIQPANGSLRDLIFLIGRKIYRDGTPAQPYMEPATKGKQSRLRQLIAQEAQRGLIEAGLA